MKGTVGLVHGIESTVEQDKGAGGGGGGGRTFEEITRGRKKKKTRESHRRSRDSRLAWKKKSRKKRTHMTFQFSIALNSEEEATGRVLEGVDARFFPPQRMPLKHAALWISKHKHIERREAQAFSTEEDAIPVECRRVLLLQDSPLPRECQQKESLLHAFQAHAPSPSSPARFCRFSHSSSSSYICFFPLSIHYLHIHPLTIPIVLPRSLPFHHPSPQPYLCFPPSVLLHFPLQYTIILPSVHLFPVHT